MNVNTFDTSGPKLMSLGLSEVAEAKMFCLHIAVQASAWKFIFVSAKLLASKGVSH